MPKLSNLKRKEFETFLRGMGFEEFPSAGKGSHTKWRKAGISRPQTIPNQDPVSEYIVKQVMETLGLKTREDFFAAFSEIVHGIKPKPPKEAPIAKPTQEHLPDEDATGQFR
jgi:predicted RNA binding protein YcfA (HicA-like mRNA interferase family)